jgi:hypothetical protein
MSANGISDRLLHTKEQSQLLKLQIAEAKRQGKVVATDGTITGSLDSSKPYYRPNNVLDTTLLPDTYNGNVPGADDNPNTGGLVAGRPWKT